MKDQECSFRLQSVSSKTHQNSKSYVYYNIVHSPFCEFMRGFPFVPFFEEPFFSKGQTVCDWFLLKTFEGKGCLGKIRHLKGQNQGNATAREISRLILTVNNFCHFRIAGESILNDGINFV